jgi:hypothetical protein
VGDPENRPARLRYTATGALAALAVAGAIAGTVALADSPPTAKTPGAPVLNKAQVLKKAPVLNKAQAPRPSASPEPFVGAIHRLVDDGTITATEGQAVDREILTGRVDPDTLASAGFTAAQLQAVQQALATTKLALAASAARTTK